MSGEGEAVPPPEAVLATVPVGPAVRGPRSALDAVLRYAAEPGLAVGPAALDRAAWGAGQALLAARLVWRDRALRRAATVPVVLTAAGCAAFAALYTWHELDPVHPAAALHLYMSVFVGLASMPPTLLQRQWVRVANEARRALGLPPGEDPFAGRSFLRMITDEWLKALRQATVVAVGVVPFLLAVAILPDWTHAPAALAALWAFYWVVVDAFELPMEVLPGPRLGGPQPWFARILEWAGRRWRPLRLLRPAGRFSGKLSTPWREELHFTERHVWECAGMGGLVGALLAVPVLNLAFRAVGIAAATALLARCGAAGEEASSPPAEPEVGRPWPRGRGPDAR